MTGPLPSQYITFLGTLAGKNKGGEILEEYTVTVLAGEGAPTVTGGWPEWMTLPRALRVGMTVLQGYPPIKLSIPIRFEAITEGARQARNIEREIPGFEWMGGRGRPSGAQSKPGGTFHGTPGHDALGDSPAIKIRTANESKEIPLVPVQFQSLLWVIDGEAGGITFDANPLRDRGGARLRQLATVFLKQLVAAPGTSADSAAERAALRAAGKGKGKVYTTSTAHDTVKLLLIHVMGGKTFETTEALKETIQINKGNRKIGTDPNKKLKPGTRVLIPLDAIRHVYG